MVRKILGLAVAAMVVVGAVSSASFAQGGPDEHACDKDRPGNGGGPKKCPPEATPTPSPSATPTSPPPSPEPVPFRPWTRAGLGLVSDIELTDLDLDGSNEVVVGGRGVGVATPESVSTGFFHWVNKWQAPDGAPGAGDWDAVMEFSLSDVNSDGLDDVVAGTIEAPYAIDGATGKTLWTFSDHLDAPEENHLPSADGARAIEVTDLNGDGTADVAFGDVWDDGITAVDIENRERLWRVERLGVVSDMASGDLDVDGVTDVVVIGGPTTTQLEVIAISGTGNVLWQQPFLGLPGPLSDPESFVKGDAVTVEVGNVIAGVAPQVVVGGATAEMEVYDGLTGVPLAFWTTPDAVYDLVLMNLDDDRERELVVTSSDLSRVPQPGQIVAYDGLGEMLWSEDVPGVPLDLEVADVAGSGAQDLVIGGGIRSPEGRYENDGFVALFEPAASSGGAMWAAPVRGWVASVDAGEFDGQATVIGAQGDHGGLVAFNTVGERTWSLRTGGRAEQLAAANLVEGGAPEIVEVSDDSFVVARRSDGTVLWERVLPGIGTPMVKEVSVTDLDGTGPDEVIVGTWDSGVNGGVDAPGKVFALDARGQTIWSADHPSSVYKILTGDLESDGAQDVVAIAGSRYGDVVRYDAAGNEVWETPIFGGDRLDAVLVPVNDDAVLDVFVVTKWPGLEGEAIAIDGATGEILRQEHWTVAATWISADGADVVFGDAVGRVVKIDPATGEKSWESPIIEAYAWDGEWTADVNGDGRRDVVGTSDDGKTRAFDGTNGSVLWEQTTPFGSPALFADTANGPDGPVILLGTMGNQSAIQALDARTGAELMWEQAHGHAHDVLGADLSGDGVDELLAGMGWNIYARALP